MKRLRIAVMPGPFPLLSTTFIFDQIVGLLALGHDVEVFAQPAAERGAVHPDFFRHEVAGRTHYWLSGRSTPLDAARRTAVLLRREPRGTLERLVRSLDPRSFGMRGASGYLWCLASELLLRPGFDVVLCHFGEHGARAEMLRRIGAFSAPIVTVFHGYDISRYVENHGASVYDELFEAGELMLPISDHWRRRLIELGCPASKIRVHRMGVDQTTIALRERTLAPGETPRILSVARLTEKKGIEYALRALGALRVRGIESEYHVVGDGPLRAELERLARDLHLEASVVFHGAQPHERVMELQGEAHVFLAPSVTARDGDQEGIPVAIMEAMAGGMPVISTRHSGIPELVIDGETGYLTAERDVDGLAHALARVLAERDQWARMGRSAHRVIAERHDRRKLDAELSAMLDQVAQSRTTR
jgi:colanic acid/amylovoran biosynthesis glycosyltransferase